MVQESTWCQDNKLSPNVCKIKGLVITFMKQGGVYVPVCINGMMVEHHAVNIIICPCPTTLKHPAKKVHQCLQFLIRLRKCGISPLISTDAPQKVVNAVQSTKPCYLLIFGKQPFFLNLWNFGKLSWLHCHFFKILENLQPHLVLNIYFQIILLLVTGYPFFETCMCSMQAGKIFNFSVIYLFTI